MKSKEEEALVICHEVNTTISFVKCVSDGYVPVEVDKILDFINQSSIFVDH